MLKILWLCNVPLPQISTHLAQPVSHGGGWLIGLSESLLCHADLELIIVFPMLGIGEAVSGETEGIRYWGFPQKKGVTKYDPETENCFTQILAAENPDIIHIWGTEYPHALAMVNACESLEMSGKVLVSIQGLCSVIARHYCAGLPRHIATAYTFRDMIRCENIETQQKKFQTRGEMEIRAIKKVRHIVGRTDLDRACTGQINPEAAYHFCNETLRNEFYQQQWDINACERHSIFFSQANYPVKGLHFMLEAMPEILKVFPDTRLFVAGNNITKKTFWQEKIKLSSYGKYILALIKRYRLEEHICFTGVLDAEQMSQRYLKSHVFVSASSIENSPNSVGEAMLLGIPLVSSDVGGVKSLLTHHEEGFLYQYDAPYMLAHYVCKIFEDDALAQRLSSNARLRGAETHNKLKNGKRMLDIYRELVFGTTEKG